MLSILVGLSLVSQGSTVHVRPGSSVATLEQAIERARSIHAHRIVVERGVYEVGRTIELGAGDNGLVIEGRNATFTGSVLIPPSKILKCSDPAILDRIIDPEARSKIQVVDLAALGIVQIEPIQPRGFPHPPHPEFNELFHDDQPMRLARWPKQGYASVQSVLDPGSGEHDGDKSRNPVFRAGERAKLWAGDLDAWFYGYWKYDWADESIPAGGIATDGTITLAKPHVYGVDKNAPFFAENLLEELDAPGEYWIDRDHAKLYFIEIKEGDRTGYRFSVLGAPLISVKGASGIDLTNLRLADSRGDGVDISDSARVRIRNCSFHGLGERAAAITGGHDCGLEHCTIDATGEGGVLLSGGDRKTLDPAHHFVDHCEISDYERLSQTYRPAVLLDGDGNRVSHCSMHDAPHSAIIFSGNDHIIEYNEFYRTITRTGDGGVVYTGRDWTARGTVIRYNYFHDNVGLRKWEPAIYFDDLASGLSAVGNVIENCHWGFLVGGGRDNDIENNVLINCDLAFDCDDRGLGWGKSMLPTLMDRLSAMPYQSPPWSDRYPALANILGGNPLAPAGNIVSHNVLVRSGKAMAQVAPEFAKTARIEDNLETTATPRERLFANKKVDPRWIKRISGKS